MKKLGLMAALGVLLLAGNVKPAEAQWWPWVVRGAAIYGGYSCLRYGCGPIPPVSMWGRPRYYNYGPPAAYYGPPRYAYGPRYYYGY